MPKRFIRYYMLIAWRRVVAVARRALTPHAQPADLARSAALGVIVGLSPFIGLHTILLLALAYLLRANKLLGLTLIYLISNPWTMVPVLVTDGRVGEMVIRPAESLFTVKAVGRIFRRARPDEPVEEHIHRVFNGKYGRQLVGRMTVGWLILSIPATVAAYLLTQRLGARILERRMILRRRRLKGRGSSPPGPPAPDTSPASGRLSPPKG